MEYIHRPKRKGVRFSKNQWRVIMLLNAVIIVLLVPYFVIRILPAVAPPGDDNNGGNIYTPGGAVFSRYRDARQSLNPMIDWEINIGGEGNDIPQAIINHGTHIHVLIVTNSTQFDFDDEVTAGSRLYMVTLSPQGATIGFVRVASGTNLNVVSAKAWGSGTLIVYNSLTGATAAHIACDGEVIASYIAPGRTAVYLSPYQSQRVIMVTRRDQGVFPSSLTLHVLSERLVSIGGISLSTDQINMSLDFISVFESVHTPSNFVVFATNTTDGHPVIFEFGSIAHPRYHDLRFPHLPNFAAQDIIPISGTAGEVFAMIGTADGIPHLVTVRFADGIFAAHSHTPLGGIMQINSVSSIRFVYIDSHEGDPTIYIIATNAGGSNAVRLNRTGTLSTGGNLTALSPIAHIAHYILNRPGSPVNESLLFGSDLDANLFLTRLSPTAATTVTTFGGSGQDIAIAATLTDRGIMTVASTTSGAGDRQDGDIGGNFGGIDTWVALIPL